MAEKINIMLEEFKGLICEVKAYKSKDDAQRHFDEFLKENFDGSKEKYDDEHGYTNYDIYWFETEVK